MLYVYVDGGCLNNGSIENSIGSFSFAIIEKETLIHTYSILEKNTTNNRMELKAIISACSFLKENGVYNDITIISDSLYSINCCTKKWKVKANLDLFKEYFSITNDMEINFEWVKGHNGNKWNELVDSLCTKAININL